MPRQPRRLGLHRAQSANAVWVNLQRGLVGSDVAAAQLAMMNRGVFVRGGATGVFDTYTWYAVNTFQRHNGLRVTGVIDVATARRLGLFDLANPTVDWTDIRRWATGPLVTKAQQLLMSRGVFVRGGATGVFDSYTWYAVNTFQRYNALRVTGVIDIATARKLGMFGGASPATTTMSLTLAAPRAGGNDGARGSRPHDDVDNDFDDHDDVDNHGSDDDIDHRLRTDDVGRGGGSGRSDGARWGRHDRRPRVARHRRRRTAGRGRARSGGCGRDLRDGTGSRSGRVSTDQHGHYRFDAIPDGNYRVAIELAADRTIYHRRPAVRR